MAETPFAERCVPKFKPNGHGGMEPSKRMFVVIRDGKALAIFTTLFAAQCYATLEGGNAMAAPLIRKRVKLTPELLAILLRHDPDTGEIFWKERPREYFDSDKSFERFNREFAGKLALNSISTYGYLVGKVLRLPISAHRAIWALEYGAFPKVIDHIDGDKLNNRISNLRDVTHRENMRNRARSKTRNTSGRIGVSWKPQAKKWLATINSLPIAYFETFEAACAARAMAEIEHGYHPNHGREE